MGKCIEQYIDRTIEKQILLIIKRSNICGDWFLKSKFRVLQGMVAESAAGQESGKLRLTHRDLGSRPPEKKR
jgi:hypothetical protein